MTRVMRAPAALRAAFAAMLLVALPGIAVAQTLYKWIDKDGRVQYSDQPPKNFAGPVTKIEPDEKPTPSAPAPVSDGKARKVDDATAGIIEMAAKKRAVREKLQANLDAARARLAAAQAALDNATPNDDERQTIQQRVDSVTPIPGPNSSSTGGMLGMGGMNGMAVRSNCDVTKNASGAAVQTCRTQIPNEAYQDRVQKLRDDVKTAEDDVSAAELAYRRGVD
jgi:hypothetical protein